MEVVEMYVDDTCYKISATLSLVFKSAFYKMNDGMWDVSVGLS